jgi:hypothetical protein
MTWRRSSYKFLEPDSGIPITVLSNMVKNGMAERTGELVLNVLWSNVEEDHVGEIYNFAIYEALRNDLATL